MKLNVLLIIFFIIILSVQDSLIASEQYADNVVSITVTTQGYDRNTPWQKLSFRKEVISGTVLKDNRILTVSYNMADHVLVEVSKFGSFHKYAAEVLLKDYQSGLALIKVTDVGFYNDVKPVAFNNGASIKEKKGQIVMWDPSGIFKVNTAEYLKSSIEYFDYAGILIHQMKSDIDAAGKGEPVFMDGKLAGICSWHNLKTKTIKIIDLEVIVRMLKDSENKKEAPFFYIEDAPLENDENLRTYIGLTNNDTGIMILNVPSKTSGSDVLKKGDVILNINGVEIDDNGLYMSEKYGKLNYYGLVYLNHFVDDIVSMKIVRNKIKKDISFKLLPITDDCLLIPSLSNDKAPKYYIVGGIVFQELTKDYLETWGKEWIETADKRLMYYYDNFARYPGLDKKRIVILSRVLPASVNVGYHQMRNIILNKVNGQAITDINHVKDVIDRSGNKFIEFDFIGEQQIILNAAEAKYGNTDILKKYNIPAPYYLGGNK
jgi:hypothetical protein